ncbi:MAG: hypothetical protein LBT10_01085 [Methanobrevibacter sp.]|jgi:hypothetical protein|nr:hypothetical protein [Methanobrevibacter sp.]
MKLKILSLIIIAILAISAIGTVSAVDLQVHIQKSGSPGLGKTYQFANNVGVYKFTNLWALAYIAHIEVRELQGSTYTSPYSKSYTCTSGDEKITLPKSNTIYNIRLSEWGGAATNVFINSSKVRDTVIPVVYDGTVAINNRHIGIDGKVYNFNGFVNLDLR